MPNVNLSGMSAEALMDLRTRVDEVLLKRRADIERQLERMGSAITVVGGRDGGSTLKGKKVPPKYRGPSGETWAGRGVRPRWLVAAIKGGKKLDDFLIDKSARKGRKKRRSNLRENWERDEGLILIRHRFKRFFREMFGLYPIPNCFANGYLANGGKRRDGNVPSSAEVDPRTKR